jgi:hypothetical protein
MTRSMRPEHRLVLAAAMPPAPARDECLALLAARPALDWSRVERAAIDWGLAPLVGRGLGAWAGNAPGASVDPPEDPPPPAPRASLPPAALLERCRSIERLTAVRNALLLHHAQGVGRLAGALGHPLVALKGADLMQTVYPGLGCRVTADLDLLARADDIPALEAALLAAGWRADMSGREWYDRHLHHGHPWTSPDGAVTMELHWGLVRPDDPFTFDAALLVERRRPIHAARGGSALTRLDAVDAALFLAAHAVRHLDAPDGAYRSLIDLAWLLAAEPGLDAEALAVRARAQRLDRVMAAALAWLDDTAPGAGGAHLAAVGRRLPPIEEDDRVRELAAMMTALAERPAHRPLAVASGVTGCWQRSGRARWAFLWRGLAPAPADVNRDLAPGQRKRPLPLRYLALAGNYLDEVRRLGPGGLAMAARLGRLRRRLSE